MNTQTNRNGLCRLGLILALALCLPLVAPHQAGAVVSYSLADGEIIETIDSFQSKTWTMEDGPCSVSWRIFSLENAAGRIEFRKRLSNGSISVKSEGFDQLEPGQQVKIGEDNVLKVTVTLGPGKVEVRGFCQCGQ